MPPKGRKAAVDKKKAVTVNEDENVVVASEPNSNLGSDNDHSDTSSNDEHVVVQLTAEDLNDDDEVVAVDNRDEKNQGGEENTANDGVETVTIVETTHQTHNDDNTDNDESNDKKGLLESYENMEGVYDDDDDEENDDNVVLGNNAGSSSSVTATEEVDSSTKEDAAQAANNNNNNNNNNVDGSATSTNNTNLTTTTSTTGSGSEQDAAQQNQNQNNNDDNNNKPRSYVMRNSNFWRANFVLIGIGHVMINNFEEKKTVAIRTAALRDGVWKFVSRLQDEFYFTPQNLQLIREEAAAPRQRGPAKKGLRRPPPVLSQGPPITKEELSKLLTFLHREGFIDNCRNILANKNTLVAEAAIVFGARGGSSSTNNSPRNSSNNNDAAPPSSSSTGNNNTNNEEEAAMNNASRSSTNNDLESAEVENNNNGKDTTVDAAPTTAAASSTTTTTASSPPVQISEKLMNELFTVNPWRCELVWPNPQFARDLPIDAVTFISKNIGPMVQDLRAKCCRSKRPDPTKPIELTEEPAIPTESLTALEESKRPLLRNLLDDIVKISTAKFKQSTNIDRETKLLTKEELFRNLISSGWSRGGIDLLFPHLHARGDIKLLKSSMNNSIFVGVTGEYKPFQASMHPLCMTDSSASQTAFNFDVFRCCGIGFRYKGSLYRDLHLLGWTNDRILDTLMKRSTEIDRRIGLYKCGNDLFCFDRERVDMARTPIREGQTGEIIDKSQSHYPSAAAAPAGGGGGAVMMQQQQHMQMQNQQQNRRYAQEEDLSRLRDGELPQFLVNDRRVHQMNDPRMRRFLSDFVRFSGLAPNPKKKLPIHMIMMNMAQNGHGNAKLREKYFDSLCRCDILHKSMVEVAPQDKRVHVNYSIHLFQNQWFAPLSGDEDNTHAQQQAPVSANRHQQQQLQQYQNNNQQQQQPNGLLSAPAPQRQQHQQQQPPMMMNNNSNQHNAYQQPPPQQQQQHQQQQQQPPVQYMPPSNDFYQSAPAPAPQNQQQYQQYQAPAAPSNNNNSNNSAHQIPVYQPPPQQQQHSSSSIPVYQPPAPQQQQQHQMPQYTYQAPPPPQQQQQHHHSISPASSEVNRNSSNITSLADDPRVRQLSPGIKLFFNQLAQFLPNDGSKKKKGQIYQQLNMVGWQSGDEIEMYLNELKRKSLIGEAIMHGDGSNDPAHLFLITYDSFLQLPNNNNNNNNRGGQQQQQQQQRPSGGDSFNQQYNNNNMMTMHPSPSPVSTNHNQQQQQQYQPPSSNMNTHQQAPTPAPAPAAAARPYNLSPQAILLAKQLRTVLPLSGTELNRNRAIQQLITKGWSQSDLMPLLQELVRGRIVAEDPRSNTMFFNRRDAMQLFEMVMNQQQQQGGNNNNNNGSSDNTVVGRRQREEPAAANAGAYQYL